MRCASHTWVSTGAPVRACETSPRTAKTKPCARRASGGPDRIVVPDGRVLDRDIDDVVAWVFSHSSTAPHLFGDRVDAFETELRSVLAAASPAGRFSVELPDGLLKVWRPA